MIRNAFEMFYVFLKGPSVAELHDVEVFLKNNSFLELVFPYMIKNRVTNLFFYFMCKFSLCGLLDKDSYRSLNQIVTFSSLRSKEYAETIAPIVSELNETDVRYAILKGFHLNNTIYESNHGFKLRDFNDVDFLVNKCDLKKVNSILKKHNYIQGSFSRNIMSIVPSSRSEQIDMLLNTHQQMQHICPSQYFSLVPGNVCLIDINYTIWEGGNTIDPIPTDYFLENSTIQTTDKGLNYKALKIEHEIVQLCIHAYKDANYSFRKEASEDLLLIKFIDLYYYFKKYGEIINWDELLRLIKNAKVENHMYLILKLVAKLFSPPYLDSFLIMLVKNISENVDLVENMTESFYHTITNL